MLVIFPLDSHFAIQHHIDHIHYYNRIMMQYCNYRHIMDTAFYFKALSDKQTKCEIKLQAQFCSTEGYLLSVFGNGVIVVCLK